MFLDFVILMGVAGIRGGCSTFNVGRRVYVSQENR